MTSLSNETAWSWSAFLVLACFAVLWFGLMHLLFREAVVHNEVEEAKRPYLLWVMPALLSFLVFFPVAVHESMQRRR